MDLKETGILGAGVGEHWYYRSKAAAMTLLVGASSRILDVGAGSGFFSRYLLQHTAAECAICVDTSYSVAWDFVEEGKLMQFRRSIDAVDADLVLLMDVLEHAEDDVGLLSEYVGKVPLGARFLVSVPAFCFLWSEHDEFLEHKRRYSLSDVEKVVRRAGLTVKNGMYYFGLVLPIAATTRLLSRWFRAGQPQSQLQRHGFIVNETMAAICRAELPILTLNRIAGLTAFCLATKA